MNTRQRGPSRFFDFFTVISAWPISLITLVLERGQKMLSWALLKWTHHHTSSIDITQVLYCPICQKLLHWISRLNWHCTFTASGPKGLHQQQKEKGNGWQQLVATQIRYHPHCSGLCLSISLLQPSKSHSLSSSFFWGSKRIWKRSGTFPSLVPYSSYLLLTYQTKLFWYTRNG